MNHNLKEKIENWLKSSKENLARVPVSHLNVMISQVIKYAEEGWAEKRISQLKPKAEQPVPEWSEWLTIVVLIVGMLSFSAAGRLLAEAIGLGPIADPVGFLIGGLLSFGVEYFATKALIDNILQNEVLKAELFLKSEQDREPVNELEKRCWGAQNSLFLGKEGGYKAPTKFNFVLALILTSIESLTVFFVFVDSGRGWFFGLLNACIPAAIIWSIAAIQADHQSVKIFKNLIKAYTPYQHQNQKGGL